MQALSGHEGNKNFCRAIITFCEAKISCASSAVHICQQFFKVIANRQTILGPVYAIQQLLHTRTILVYTGVKLRPSRPLYAHLLGLSDFQLFLGADHKYLLTVQKSLKLAL